MLQFNSKEFINEVLSDAYEKAIENQSGKITISQLDEIIREHPVYEEIHIDSLEDYVIEIEQVLESNNRL